eukprot:3004427-Pyramimonas_sp.AAC.1
MQRGRRSGLCQGLPWSRGSRTWLPGLSLARSTLELLSRPHAAAWPPSSSAVVQSPRRSARRSRASVPFPEGRARAAERQRVRPRTRPSVCDATASAARLRFAQLASPT